LKVRKAIAQTCAVQPPFSEFLDSPEEIATNVLTDRLALIEAAAGRLRKPYRLKPKRFECEPTDKGRDLLPVMQSICVWANKHYPHTWVAPESFMAERKE
jgi:DNA-binding HxlR family transcriptional regulator